MSTGLPRPLRLLHRVFLASSGGVHVRLSSLKATWQTTSTSSRQIPTADAVIGEGASVSVGF